MKKQKKKIIPQNLKLTVHFLNNVNNRKFIYIIVKIYANFIRKKSKRI